MPRKKQTAEGKGLVGWSGLRGGEEEGGRGEHFGGLVVGFGGWDRWFCWCGDVKWVKVKKGENLGWWVLKRLSLAWRDGVVEMGLPSL